jgi:hypothetical protein
MQPKAYEPNAGAGSPQSCPACGLANGYQALPFQQLPAAMKSYTLANGGIDQAIKIMQVRWQLK